MGLMVVTVPLYNAEVTVNAYLFRFRADQSEYIAGYSPLFEVLRKAGLDAFSAQQPVFLPVSGLVLLKEDFDFPPDRVVLLLDEDVRPDQAYLDRLDELIRKGFRVAVRDPEQAPLLERARYLFVDVDYFWQSPRDAVRRLKKRHHNLRIVASGIPTVERFTQAAADEFDLFEGAFYSDPPVPEDSKITPLKSNLIRLLNVVRDENFEFSVVADVVRADPALSISLMRFINSSYLGVRHRVRTIHHAVVILGQWEVRKWVTASVFKSMGTDRPGELTRLSLLRAKAAENMAALFGLGTEAQSLFLMGLFSLLDVILGVSMVEATKMVVVSSDIQSALVEKDGPFYAVLEFIKCYEQADWPGVIRLCDAHGMDLDEVANAYLDALYWYNELITMEVRPHR